ncbi:ABC transporter substrate-binding protein [Corynebacterium auriscanis]|uniref:taurine ABC transporter substrate-binding protein n=1 Tax=Corynebacterium auriscanis TaxID=99807 RepID=UPI003CF0065A
MPNANVQWTRFPTGQDIVRSFASSSVDVAGLGSTPSAKALTSPLDLNVSVNQVNARIEASEALVAKEGNSVRDLRGKTIAVPFSSTSHYSLLNALRRAGLDPKKDVTVTNVSPDHLPAAWASDQIDAAYVWEPTLSNIKASGTIITDSARVARQGAATYNVTLADNDWSRTNSALLSTWTALQNWAAQEYRNNPDSFTEAIAAQSGISKESARIQLGGSHFYTSTEQPQALEDVKGALFDTAEYLHSEGEVDEPASQRHYQEAVRYNDGEDSVK